MSPCSGAASRRSLLTACVLCLALARSVAAGQAPDAPDPAARLDAANAAAAAAVVDGELQIAESRYRAALAEGWMLVGALDAAARQWPDAARAFERASHATVDAREAQQSLALVQIYSDRAGEAVRILTRLVAADRSDIASGRLLAQALAANGQPAEAVQALEETAAIAPDDPELMFLLASGYLRVKRVDEAARLFAEIARRRPIPQTHVLIGRTYRDHGQFDRAESSLRAALALDPHARRAHYYLGTVAILRDGPAKLDEAITEFQQEAALASDDPIVNLRLGMALVEARRPADAVRPLQIATAAAEAPAEAFFSLGRSLLALDRVPEAIAALRRALDLAQARGMGAAQIGGVHYQLAMALRRSGAESEAAREFTEAERLSAQHTERSRSQLASYLADAPDQDAVNARPPVETAFPLATLEQAARDDLRRHAVHGVANASFNLGVLHARADRPLRAIEFLQEAAALDPAFPQVQYSLGVACFNAKQYDNAVAALRAAVTAAPGDANATRMLALAWMNAGEPGRAAELLRNDPARDGDPNLQYAYGLSLLRDGRPQQALIVFRQLAASAGESAALDAVIGQALAKAGQYEEAIHSLEQAVTLDPKVFEAHAALGEIYLRQGRLPEAAAALREEIHINPQDVPARHNLATVLDLQGNRDEALSLLRHVLAEAPAYPGAHYLLGKILLAQGAAEEAVGHLEEAARLDAGNANVHYQLAQAYQRLGRSEPAEREFERYRGLKDRSAGRTR